MSVSIRFSLSRQERRRHIAAYGAVPAQHVEIWPTDPAWPDVERAAGGRNAIVLQRRFDAVPTRKELLAAVRREFGDRGGVVEYCTWCHAQITTDQVVATAPSGKRICPKCKSLGTLRPGGKVRNARQKVDG